MSKTLMVTIFVGLGLPVAFILVGSIYVCVKKYRERMTTSTYGKINWQWMHYLSYIMLILKCFLCNISQHNSWSSLWCHQGYMYWNNRNHTLKLSIGWIIIRYISYKCTLIWEYNMYYFCNSSNGNVKKTAEKLDWKNKMALILHFLLFAWLEFYESISLVTLKKLFWINKMA